MPTDSRPKGSSVDFSLPPFSVNNTKVYSVFCDSTISIARSILYPEPSLIVIVSAPTQRLKSVRNVEAGSRHSIPSSLAKEGISASNRKSPNQHGLRNPLQRLSFLPIRSLPSVHIWTGSAVANTRDPRHIYIPTPIHDHGYPRTSQGLLQALPQRRRHAFQDRLLRLLRKLAQQCLQTRRGHAAAQISPTAEEGTQRAPRIVQLCRGLATQELPKPILSHGHSRTQQTSECSA